ncbi:subtilisin-like protease 4 [Typha angustifolia]|uniref:subtilisin-like protease 4 n=1 Tax=Typha angustifolia TaxID=59011 RepID=UPI003C2E807E
MEKRKPIPFWVLLPFFYASLLLVPLSQSQLLPITNEPIGDTNHIHTYIVYVEQPENSELLTGSDLREWHESFLPNTTLDSGEPRLIYSYRDVLSGFAAKLTTEEVIEVQAKDGVLDVQQDQVHPLLTTYTHELLGLSNWNNGAWWGTNQGEGVVIGVLDTGILPTHPSFNDDGMPPPPVTWRGNCTSTSGVACNNKIIGAAAFNGTTVSSALDTDGHGTHVAGTAAGNFVDHANVLGTANGTAAGMAPRAHLAIYKVCFEEGCATSNTLAAIDRAIADGVDVLSMSIGGNATYKYYYDGIAQGSLAALSHGITAVAAAGNDGPEENTLAHDAPWVLTVGASSTDRRITSILKLGDGTELAGESAFQPSSFNSSMMLPIAFPGEFWDVNATFCLNGSLDYIDVRGKIVMCYAGLIKDVEKGEVVYAAGGAAMILANIMPQGYTTFSDAHVLPVVRLSFMDGRKARTYYLSQNNSAGGNATAAIMFKGTTFGNRPSPAVASFSSRGPAPMNGGILKPDVLAPGVNILAAWPYDVGPNPSGLATSTFNFESGTSMATPHVAGIAALVKKKHPIWTPAMIRSAIITSTQDVDMDGNPIVDEGNNKTGSIFATGSGQVNPRAALDPGLVYNTDPNDYVGYLCGLGYSDYELRLLYKRRISCFGVPRIGASSLNYPSIQVTLPRKGGSVTVKRTVTNVGDRTSAYQVRITEPEGVRVDLSTYSLQFSRILQEKSFNVTLSVSPIGPGKRKYSDGKIEWVSNNRVVKSPIAVKFY